MKARSPEASQALHGSIMGRVVGCSAAQFKYIASPGYPALFLSRLLTLCFVVLALSPPTPSTAAALNGDQRSRSPTPPPLEIGAAHSSGMSAQKTSDEELVSTRPQSIRHKFAGMLELEIAIVSARCCVRWGCGEGASCSAGGRQPDRGANTREQHMLPGRCVRRTLGDGEVSSGGGGGCLGAARERWRHGSDSRRAERPHGW